MDTQDTVFLNRLVALQGGQADYEKVESTKKAMLERLTRGREDNRAVLRKGAGLVAVRGEGRKKKDRMQLTDLKNRDQTEEFDIDDQRSGFGLQDEDVGAHEDVSNLINRQVAEMMAMVERENPDTGKIEKKRLFSDEEIAAQVYDPLVRQGLISETMVPAIYSRTQELLDQSVAAYEERLKKDKRGTVGNFFAENAGLITSSLSLMTTVAGGGMDSKVGQDKVGKDGASALQSSWDPKKNLGEMQDALKSGSSALEKANQSAKFASQGLSCLLDVVKPGIEEVAGKLSGDEEPSEEGGASGLTPQQAAGLAQVLLGAAAAELAVQFAPHQLGIEMASGFGGCVKRAEVANLLVKGAVKPLAASLGASYAEALKRLDPDPGNSADPFKKSADAFTKALTDGLADDAVVGAIASADEKALVADLNRIGKDAAAAAGPEVTALFASDTAKVAVREKAAQLMAEEFADDGPRAEDEKEHAKAGKDHVPDWIYDEKKKRWTCAVCAAEQSDDPQIFAGMLERRIAQLERDKALLEWSTRLVGMGIDLAANFIAPLAMVGSAVKMAKNILLAGMRTRDLVVFLDKRKGMLNAASAFSQPVAQFIVNSRSQMLHYAANAAFEAVKIIGAALQCGGITAPAGFATTTAATMAQAMEAVIYEIDKRVKLEVAWSTYRAYLARKENRRLGLIAIRKNPTLAKYAVAWGALIRKDPLVVDFIGACGLTPETLKDPNANLDAVVKYLEARMPDDNVVTGRAGDFDVGEVQLTPVSWTRTQTQAVKEAKLQPGGSGMIVACLRKWQKESPALRATATAPALPTTAPQTDQDQDAERRRQALSSARGILVELNKALTAYTPLTTAGKSCHGMVDARSKYLQKAVAQQDDLQHWVPA